MIEFIRKYIDIKDFSGPEAEKYSLYCHFTNAKELDDTAFEIKYLSFIIIYMVQWRCGDLFTKNFYIILKKNEEFLGGPTLTCSEEKKEDVRKAFFNFYSKTRENVSQEVIASVACVCKKFKTC